MAARKYVLDAHSLIQTGSIVNDMLKVKVRGEATMLGIPVCPEKRVIYHIIKKNGVELAVELV